MEEYFQEADRAGRDGLPAKATIYYNSYDTSMAWRHAVSSGVGRAENTRNDQQALKRTRRKTRTASIAAPSSFVYVICNRDCHSRVGLYSHSRRCSASTWRYTIVSRDERLPTSKRKRGLQDIMIKFVKSTSDWKREIILQYFGNICSCELCISEAEKPKFVTEVDLQSTAPAGSIAVSKERETFFVRGLSLFVIPWVLPGLMCWQCEPVNWFQL